VGSSVHPVDKHGDRLEDRGPLPWVGSVADHRGEVDDCRVNARARDRRQSFQIGNQIGGVAILQIKTRHQRIELAGGRIDTGAERLDQCLIGVCRSHARLAHVGRKPWRLRFLEQFLKNPVAVELSR
jgi:hypothetical protein